MPRNAGWACWPGILFELAPSPRRSPRFARHSLRGRWIRPLRSPPSEGHNAPFSSLLFPNMRVLPPRTFRRNAAHAAPVPAGHASFPSLLDHRCRDEPGPELDSQPSAYRPVPPTAGHPPPPSSLITAFVAFFRVRLHSFPCSGRCPRFLLGAGHPPLANRLIFYRGPATKFPPHIPQGQPRQSACRPDLVRPPWPRILLRRLGRKRSSSQTAPSPPGAH